MSRKKKKIRAWLYEDAIAKAEIGGYVPKLYLAREVSSTKIVRVIVGKLHSRYSKDRNKRYVVFLHDTEKGASKGLKRYAYTKGISKASKIAHKLLFSIDKD